MTIMSDECFNVSVVLIIQTEQFYSSLMLPVFTLEPAGSKTLSPNQPSPPALTPPLPALPPLNKSDCADVTLPAYVSTASI